MDEVCTVEFNHRRAEKRKDDYIEARHICVVRRIRRFMYAWYRRNDESWRAYDDCNELDVFCPSCGKRYPTSDQIEAQYQEFIRQLH